MGLPHTLLEMTSFGQPKRRHVIMSSLVHVVPSGGSLLISLIAISAINSQSRIRIRLDKILAFSEKLSSIQANVFACLFVSDNILTLSLSLSLSLKYFLLYKQTYLFNKLQ